MPAKDERHEYDEDGFDASAFEAEMRLSLSLANQAIAKRHGRTAAPLPAPNTPLPFQVRPSNLGVGAKPASRPQGSLEDAKLRQQLMPKKRRREDDEPVAKPPAAADGSSDDEDSRASVFKARTPLAPVASTSAARPPAPAALPAPANAVTSATAAITSDATLSKNQRKKLRKREQAAAGAAANGGKTLGALADLAGYGSGSSRVTSPALSTASLNGRPSPSPRPEKSVFSPPPSAARPKPPYAPIVPPEEESSDGGAIATGGDDAPMSEAEPAREAEAMDTDPPPDARPSTPESAPPPGPELSKSQRKRRKRQESERKRKAEAEASMDASRTPS